MRRIELAPICLFVCAILFVFTSCAHDEAARYYASQEYEARELKEVEVLYEEPQQPYEVIADFQARGASIEYMRKKAAKVGADAVIITTLGGYRDYSEEWAGKDRHSSWYSRIAATAIKYRK